MFKRYTFVLEASESVKSRTHAEFCGGKFSLKAAFAGDIDRPVYFVATVLPLATVLLEKISWEVSAPPLFNVIRSTNDYFAKSSIRSVCLSLMSCLWNYSSFSYDRKGKIFDRGISLALYQMQRETQRPNGKFKTRMRPALHELMVNISKIHFTQNRLSNNHLTPKSYDYHYVRNVYVNV